ncbi:MAG TPA: 4-hydroxy-3-methylbut-2-enyl diphosphate reductase [Gammaproteobacteria bacterium]
MEILLANPRGFCAGVDRAIAIVERALELFGAPVYVRHEIVHNRYVVDDLRRRGAEFVEELDEVPDNATVIFSAHGVPRSVHDEGKRRGLRVFDATCPLVTKVHLEVARYARDGLEVILVGHRGHPEVVGTLGQYDGPEGSIHVVEKVGDVATLQVRDPAAVAFVTQTTLSMDDTHAIVDALQARFPTIRGPKKADICYATQNRQDAVKARVDACDLILVVGSPNSSNSNRLREIAAARGVAAHLLDSPEELDPAWLDGVGRVGVTAGASAPEVLVKGVVDRLVRWGGHPAVEQDGIHEEVVFPLPKALQEPPATAVPAPGREPEPR